MTATVRDATDPLPTGLDLTALDPAFREDPYPILARLREREPVHRDRVLNRVVFTRHDDVAAILRHPGMWTDPRKANPGTFSREYLGRDEAEPSMLLMDDPGHRRLRGLVSKAFTPRAARAWRPRTREVARRLATGLEEGEFDLMERFAGPLPTVVIAEVLGIDASLHDRFKRWSDATVVVAFNPAPGGEEVRRAQEAQIQLDEFFRHEIEARRRAPGSDLLSDLIRAEEAGDRLSEDELVQQCNLLLVAGNVTTTDLIGNGVKALLDHPAELEKLRARPELLAHTVEEALRYDTPVTNSARIAHEDMVMGGVAIERGESLSVSLAAANRDPAVYPEPDLFDIERPDAHHQSFGGGRHLCLGAHLARLEAQEAIAALIDRFPRLALGGGGHRYAAIPSFRGLEVLWVAGSS